MTLATWPTDLFKAAQMEASLQGRVLSGGVSSSGLSQVVRTDGGGLWRIVFGGIQLRRPDLIRAWRALEVILDGGVANVIVPICDLRQAPRPLVGGVPAPPTAPTPHSDDSFFDDETGYVSNLIVAETVGAADLRATTLDIDISVGVALRGGEQFTIVHPTAGPRMYRIGQVQSAGTVHTVRFLPPLREAVADGAAIDFDNPRNVMRLADPDGMRLALDMGRFATVGVTFIESFA